MRFHPLALARGMGLLLGVVAIVRGAPYQAGPWQVDVTVVPDKPAILLGEPTSLSYVVRNLSSEDLQILVGGDYENELGRPSSFQVRVMRSDGTWVEQPKVGFSAGGLVGPKPLPAGGTYAFRLFLPHWATFEIAGSYTITCRRTLQLLRAGSGADFAKQEIRDVATEAKTKIEIEPPDPAALGRLIDEYGETMLRARGEKEGDDAVLALSWIDDPRVVPYFRRALAIRSYTIKFIALHALGKFPTDEALAALQAAMKTKAADLDYPNAEQAARSAASLRAAAAGALGRSKHPKAREFLLTQRNDEAEDVRLVVLHVVATLPAAEAVPILQEMARDQSPRVREEAQRYLAARVAKAK
jgi:hypothetical protein